MDAKSSPLKVVKSALIVMPPPEKWSAIQHIRRLHDKSFFRWMPHINVLYPFVPDHSDGFVGAASAAREALARLQPFKVRLDKFRHFVHGKHSCTLWLDPEQVTCPSACAMVSLSCCRCAHVMRAQLVQTYIHA